MAEGKLLPRKYLTPSMFLMFRARCMVCKVLGKRGYTVQKSDRYMWEDEFVDRFGLEPELNKLNFIVHKEDNEKYRLLIIFADGNVNAGTIRQYNEYMKAYDLQYAVILKHNRTVSRLALKAIASSIPSVYFEFINVTDIVDWAGDRDGVDYGPGESDTDSLPGILAAEEAARQAVVRKEEEAKAAELAAKDAKIKARRRRRRRRRRGKSKGRRSRSRRRGAGASGAGAPAPQAAGAPQAPTPRQPFPALPDTEPLASAKF